MSQWWHLPTEIVDWILSHVSFLDYVALTQTNSFLREALDNTRVLQLVLTANFAQKIDSFEWSFADLNGCLQKQNLWNSYWELNHFLERVDGISFLESSQPMHQLHLQREIQKFATEETYVVPLMVTLDALTEELSRSLLRRVGKIPISRVSWTRLLMHLQNFQKAVNFFQKADPGVPSSLERCLFEVSRADLNFPQLVHWRTTKIYHIRQEVRRFLPTSNGSITFANWPSFLKFLKELVIVIARALPKPNGKWPALNILRAYRGDGVASNEMRMAMVAKILTEEVFRKFRIKVNGHSTKLSVRPSAIMIWVGPIEVRVMTDPTDVQVIARGIDPITLQSPLGPLTTDRMLKNIEITEQPSEHSICCEFPWKPTNLRWKFYVQAFAKSLSNELISSIIDFETDLLSIFFSCILSDQDQLQNANLSRLDAPLNDETKQNKYRIGQIVLNQNLGYIGAVILIDENKSYRLCPHDFSRIYVAHESSLIPAERSQMGNLCLNWLLQSEGFLFNGTCLFQNVEFQGEHIIFSNKTS